MKITDSKIRVTKEKSFAYMPVEIIQVPTGKKFWQLTKPKTAPSKVRVRIPIVADGIIKYIIGTIGKELELLQKFVVSRTSYHTYIPGQKKDVKDLTATLTSGTRVYDNIQDITSQFGNDTNIIKVEIPKGTHYMVSDEFMMPMKVIPLKIIR